MCSSSDPSRFPCVCFAGIGSVTTAFSGQSGTTVWQRSDRHRKRFDRASCETSACDSGAITTVSATRRRRFRLRDRSFLTLSRVSLLRYSQCNALPLRVNSRVTDFLSTEIPLVLPVFRGGAHLRSNRRGRESNPRIAVLQTATLPLGYPAVSARADNIVVAALVSSADRKRIDVRRGERLYNSAASTL